MILEIMLGVVAASSLTALCVVSLKLYIKLTTGMCKSQVCLVGKTALITGANTGIGYETAIDFAKRGAKVILACRDENKAKEAVNRIIKETHNSQVVYKLVDLTSFTSVRKFAMDINNTEERLDILVNNAGAARLGNTVTEDGIDAVLQTNYFSHFLLTMLLVDLMQKYPSRIVNVAAWGASLGKIDFRKLTSFETEAKQYITSKLCQVLFTIEFARRYKDTNITAYSLHPGVIKTEIFRNLTPVLRSTILVFIDIFFKTVTEGAQTQIYCAIENGLEKYSGEHFQDCRNIKRYKSARDPDVAKKLWEESERIVKLKTYEERI
ncbi:unnamed protein product [Phyllotreta striolata]|uniref:Uncharacterized protein n=1 Tax=Phyllotreta striolata TaxID=444603 RepID=A0A9N9TVQ7_PHYSR|nr:unnamed protein product [Phyllotreta striolata]